MFEIVSDNEKNNNGHLDTKFVNLLTKVYHL